MKRVSLLREISDHILNIDQEHPLRVAIDGIDAAGKTTFADELTGYLRASGRTVIRASIDSFHNPRDVRYRLGTNSPEGYYHDSFDYEALCTSLLAPLGPGGNRIFCRQVFDFVNDQPLPASLEMATPNDILLLDGVFLLRRELLPYWDFRIYLHISFETSLARALERDGVLFGEQAQIEARYRERYIPGQRIYLGEADPAIKANIVIDNNDPPRARITRMPQIFS